MDPNQIAPSDMSKMRSATTVHSEIQSELVENLKISESSLNESVGNGTGDKTSQAVSPCPVCSIITKAVNRSAAYKSNDPEYHALRTWGGFLSRRHCDGCQMIVKRMIAAKQPGEEMFKSKCPLELSRFPDDDSYYISANLKTDPHGDGPISNHPSLRLVPSEELNVGYPHSMEFDPLCIDLGRIRLWLQYCDQNHNDSCLVSEGWHSTHPVQSLILIDVNEFCLTQSLSSITRKYVALSYVWGRLPDVLELTSSNISALCVPNALRLPEIASRIPRTIMDAMTVCSAIGVRYLWVYRLCIVQDSTDHLRRQLGQMASIFADSYCCIIAMDGNDANYGLPGTCHTSPRSTSIQQEAFNFAPDLQMVEGPLIEPFENQMPWQTRGWTFQERILSPRHLVFTGSTVYWACRKSVWYETFSCEPDGCHQFDKRYEKYSRRSAFTLETDLWPDISLYFELVREYNQRGLTFEGDALRAFSAIITAMTASFPGGFIFGIPTFLFDIGLLWSRVSVLKRRYDFPSWSWVGWSGEVNLDSTFESFWHPVIIGRGLFAHGGIAPAVNWNLTYRDEQPLYKIDNSYYQYTQLKYHEDKPLPAGWKRNIVKDDFMFDRDGNVEFTHPKYPGQGFNYPFPDSLATMEFPVDPYPSYLKIQAKSCMLRLGRCCEQEIGSECLNVDLEDEIGRWAGAIESLFTDKDQYTIGDCCEVVAISYGYVKRVGVESADQPLPEMDYADCIYELGTYEFYNVMWIERVESVAYRVAIGRVWKEAWDRQMPVDANILLG